MIDLRKIFRNLFSVSVMRLFTSVFSFLLFSILARQWGASLLGEFSTVFAFFMFLLQLPLLGLHIVIAREVAAEPSSSSICGTNAFLVSLPSSLLIAALISSVGVIFYPANMHHSFFLVSLACPLMAFTAVAEAILTGQEKMQVISWVTIAETLCRVSVCLTLVLLGDGLTSLFAAFFGARLIAVILYWAKAGMNDVIQLSKGSWKIVSRYLKQCPTFFGILLLSVGIGRFDFIFLSLLGSMQDVGLYSPPFKVYEMGLMVPSVVTLVLFPSFARAFAHSKDQFEKLFKSMFRVTLTVGLPLVIILASLSKFIIPMIFGDEYVSGTVVLQLLSFAILFIAMDQVLTVVVLAGHREDLELKILMVAFAIYLSLLLLLIPLFGFYGAAVATCVTAGSKLVFRYALVRRKMQIQSTLSLLRSPVLSGLAMSACLLVIPGRFPVVALVSAVSIYVVTLVWTGGVSKADAIELRSLLSEPG